MLHTLYRLTLSTWKALTILLVFGAWGCLARLATGSWDAAIAVEIFALIFFAPAAFANAWDDIGD